MQVEIREWRKKDATELVRVVHNTDQHYLRVVGRGEYDIGSARTFINSTKARRGIFRAIIVDGVVAGEISVRPGQDILSVDGEIGYYLDSSYEGQGIMTRAVALAVEEAWRDLDIERISAYICTKNMASMRVLEHNGFAREGVMRRAARIDGELVDVAIYARLR